MTTRIKSMIGCYDEFDEIRKRISETRSILENHAKWFLDNFCSHSHRLPAEVSTILEALDQKLRTIEQTSDDLRYFFLSNPLHTLLNGYPLNKEQYYLQAAMGNLITPSETGAVKDAYEEFALYYYSDDEMWGYINPSKQPDPPPDQTGDGEWTYYVDRKPGVLPEDVRTSFLRADQLAFFRDFEPELFSRFRND